jgi:hypothetical protein
MTRFGQTVYLISSFLAGGFLIVGLYLAFTEYRDGISYATGFVIVGIAALIWLLGYLARNVINAEANGGGDFK